MFSRTVRIMNNLTLYSVNIYPNPVVDLMKIKFHNTLTTEPITVTIIDAAGRKVLVQKSTMAVGSNEMVLNLKGFVPGMYFIKIMNKNNEVFCNQKFIKE